MKQVLIGMLLACCVGAINACGSADNDGGAAADGSAGSACESSGACSDGLVCIDGVCGEEGSDETQSDATLETESDATTSTADAGPSDPTDDVEPSDDEDGAAQAGEGDDATATEDVAMPTDDASDAGPVVVDPSDPCADLMAGDFCALDDCCHENPVCTVCLGDDGCPDSGMACQGESACDDEDACSDDQCTCVGGEAACSYTDAPDDTVCVADPNACTLGDSCLAGQCLAGDPMPLDDGNPCTEDLCVKGEVVNQALLEGACSDENECTLGDHCVMGACVAGDPVECAVVQCANSATCVPGEGCVEEWLPEGALCDDGDACTIQAACNAEHTCEAVESQPCDDGDPCTLDFCAAGECLTSPIAGCGVDPSECQSAADCTAYTSVCTVGECVAGACQSQPIVSLCDDGDDGTCNDACLSGVCVGQTCSSYEPGEVCETALVVESGVPFSADLCEYDDDVTNTWCGANGREMVLIVHMKQNPGQIDVKVTEHFPGMVVNFRMFEQHVCENGGEGHCLFAMDNYSQMGIGYGFDGTDTLYFMVTSTENTCGPFTLTLTAF